MKLTKSKALKVVTRALELIEDPETWRKYYFASTELSDLAEQQKPQRDHSIRCVVPPSHQDAVSFCARGAILRALHEEDFNGKEGSGDEVVIATIFTRTLGLEVASMGPSAQVNRVSGWNNVSSHDEVVSGFRKVITVLSGVAA